MNGLKSILLDQNSSFYRVRIAVRGFGILSKACSQILDMSFLNDLLTLVLQRIKHSDYKDDAERSKKLLEHLPDYIQSLSEIMKNMKHLTAMQLSYLELIMIQLMRDFYYLNSNQHELVITSVLGTFSNLRHLGGSVFHELMDKVVFQGIIWACDRILPYEQDWTEEKDWKDNVTYEKYLPLWKGLVSDNRSNYQKISMTVLNVMLEKLFNIIEKLNFNLEKRKNLENQEYDSCDPNVDFVPVKPQDFHIFFNLVEFYVSVLKSISIIFKKEVIAPWIEQACEQLIQKIYKHPLISGFVKLLEVIMKLGNDTKYFERFENNNSETSNRKLKDMLVIFLKHCIQRTEQSSSELQLSYLRLLFTFPTFLLRFQFNEMIPIFMMAFDYGKNLPFLWIASMSLRCMENLVEEAEDYSREKLLKKVMPVLETFLTTENEQTKLIIQVEILKSKQRKKLKFKKNYNYDGDETDLTQFQKRIISFIGKKLNI